ncbi:MAG: RNA polymerase sigma factor [Planctomycetota bacterium]|nr:RNA polymerase sigma factor [Planctomycetota bacterium]
MEQPFDEVYTSYGAEVHAYLARLLGNAASAEEVCQETFVRYLAHEDALAGLNGELRPWLYRVATNLGIDRLRRRKTRKARVELDTPGARCRRKQTDEPDAGDLDLEACIRREIDLLPPDLRATFLLRAHHALPYRDVARALMISERAAKARFKKTRELLAHRLRHLLDEPQGGR